MSESLVVGNVTTQSTYYPWPDYWSYQPFVYPTTYVYPMSDEYANEIEVEQNEHDATLRFYRKSETSKSLVKTITVPISLLTWLQDSHE